MSDSGPNLSPAQQREEALFAAALAKPSAERAAFLDGACHGDPALRQRLEALLAAHEQPDELLGDSATATLKVTSAAAPATITAQAGDHIGPYKLREKIGEGGCGVVYVAEQEKPVRRRVALKVIKLGMDTKQVVARFEAERQALAMMDHPNIAKVLDAGKTEVGRPFFVMELVRGIKITDYCDQNHLPTQERIDLFIQVCQAIQHAHQKGIIHRDIKPSNILVTLHDGVPVPKVIDFGIAKATEGRLTDVTVYTQLHQFIGTPAYMSPEQAEMSGLDVDTRADIYSLGVLLYELLTGRTPFDAQELISQGIDMMRRTIREKEPAKPSTRLATLKGEELTTTAKRRSVESSKLAKLLRGDLDWIVMKCLEKDRKRRYDTANGLALDLQRHLRNEVVIARPPTTAYLLQKLIRRNKLAFAAGAAIAISLIIGIAASMWQAERAKGEAVRAEREAKRSAAAFEELRASAPAFAEQARALAAREQFADAISKLDYAIKLRPDAAEYLVAKADLLQCQLKLAEAAAIYREAMRLKPGLTRAEASAKLCDELLATPTSVDGKLTRETLAKLHLAMQKQQRPAAELLPVARLLGEEKKLLVDYWFTRLKDLPVSAERPLKDRLTVREDGRLALDLSDTKVIDLSPLAGAPLAVLNVSASKDQSELSDLSPLRGLELVELNISKTSVANLGPLREMRTLEKLEITGSKVTDLSALDALRLKNLAFRDCAISDLTPIRKMPIEEINLRGTRVADLSPLIGMPIKSIDLSMAPVLDFSALAQLPLEKCYLQRNRITDLSVLRGKALKELTLWASIEARNYAVLSDIKTLELLLLPSEYRSLPAEDYEAIGALRNHPKLRQLGSEIMNQMGYAATGSKDIFWRDWDREQTFVPALRRSGINFTMQKLPTGSYALDIENQPLRDVFFLKGAPISELNVVSCQVSDLTPLRDVPLEYLNIPGSPITDLSPLRGKQIKTLYLTYTRISDLSPLTSLPLKNLYLGNCDNVTDVAALSQISTLEKLTIPMQAANIQALRKLPKLERLAYQLTAAGPYIPETTAAEFWKEYDANPWIAGLANAGVKAKSLKRLDDGTWDVSLQDTPISDVAFLQGAPISRLNISATSVADLRPLHGMNLKSLSLWSTKVADLTPLEGMPLEQLWINNCPIDDLTPLRGMRLTQFYAEGTHVRDISALRGMPLTDLRLYGCDHLTDLSALAEVKELIVLALPPKAKNYEFLRTLPKVERIGFGYSGQDGRPDKTAAEFWKEYYGQKWLRVLRESGIGIKASKQLPDGTWDLDLSGSKFSDLTLLKGAPLSRLHLGGTSVRDLRPLQELALASLNLDATPVVDLSPLSAPALSASLQSVHLWRSKVTDFSPLAGCTNLETLDVPGTHFADLEIVRGRKLRIALLAFAQVTNISVLAGMPLERVTLFGTAVTDISPLLQCPTLTELTLPVGARDVSKLRSLPKLVKISIGEVPGGGAAHTAAEFWKEYDQKAVNQQP